MKFVALLPLLFLTACGPPAFLTGATNQALLDGTYQVPAAIAPKESQIVSQWLANKIPSYPKNLAPNSWWFCGHASVATALNHLRQKSPTTAQQITQLEWLHSKLLIYQGKSYATDPHRQASIDALKSLLVAEKSDEFVTTKVATWSRESAKDQIAQALKDGSYVVALGLTNGGVGHFQVVHKIEMKANALEGGTAYFSDVLIDRSASLGFKTFLNRLSDAGTVGQYSFLKIRKK